MLDSVGEFFYKRRSQGLPGLSWPWQSFLPGYAQVAQLVEQWTENPRVGGSIPPLGTTFPPNSNELGGFYFSENHQLELDTVRHYIGDYEDGQKTQSEDPHQDPP